MSERDGYEHGAPCWVDHSSTDPDAAAEFYGGLLGWETEDMMPPDAPGHYIMCRLRGRDVAAFGSQQAEGAPPIWNTYVWVDSADDAVEKARAAGGSAMGEPFDIFDAGRMAVLQDQAGAWLCVWQAGTQRGAGLVNEPGTWCWSELATRDPEGSERFYGEVFGWQAVAADLGGGAQYTLWHRAGEVAPDTVPLAGMSVMGDEWPADVPPHWSIAFAVDDTDAKAARAEELGASIRMAPFDTPVGRTAVMADPLGAAFSVITLESPDSPAP
jgi:predicted enzyme related to lactoylglutathione lyase